MGLKKTFAIAIIAVAIPVVFLAASVHPANGQRAQAQPAAPPAPNAAVPAPMAAPAPESALGAPVNDAPQALAPTDAPEPGTPRIGPIGPRLRSQISRRLRHWLPAVLAPVAPQAPQVRSDGGMSQSHGYSYSFGNDDEDRFVIVSGKSDVLTMSGSTQDARHVEKLKKQIAGDFIWFQRDEKSYIIRDQATIDRARKLWAPQEELGKKQEELGSSRKR